MGFRGTARALVFAVVALSSTAVAAPTAPQPEPNLKAELVERFTRFVEWGVLPEMVTLCVVGETPIESYLRNIARRRGIKGKPARVVEVEAEHVTACQVVLIAGDDTDQLRAVVSRTDGRPILSIAETPGAAQAGAIINLYIADQHVRFEVNTRAAKRGKLTLRSKLLELARIVDDKQGPR